VAQDWGFELLEGLGKLFLNPITYYLFFLAAFLGVSRVKRERLDFHVRVENAYYELRQLLPLGMGLGLVLSILTIGLGLVIPIETIIFVGILTILWSLTTRIRMISPIYTVGLSFFATLFFLRKEQSFPYIKSYTPEWDLAILPSIAVLLALLIVAEGIFISRNGSKGTSPKMIKSKRGLSVGVHEVKRIWMLPVFLLIPGEALTIPFDWWPLFSIGDHTYSILLVPFALGFHQQVQGSLAYKAIKQFGKRILKFGVMLTCLSAVGYWVPLASILIVAIGIIGREALAMRQRLVEESLPFYFSQRNDGVKILGVIPDSAAEKMGLKVGELITKVNGETAIDEDSFYEALQKNAAHCKLEVLDHNDQIRLLQRALYEEDHHELGILFVQGDKNWEDEAV
jgi:PDZ domain